jgi:hypothetical protein
MNLCLFDKAHQQRAVIGLAANPIAPLSVLRKLMHVPGAASTMVVRSGFLPDELAEALLALCDPHIAFLLDRDDRVSPAILERIAGHPNVAVREASMRMAREWVSNGRVFVRLDLLERLTDQTGEAAWTKLAGDPDPQMRRAVARAWSGMPDNIRRALLTDPEPSVRAAACPSWRPAPIDLHEPLIAHPATRASVAEYISLTPQLAAQLAGDDDEEVRWAVAKNPGLPALARDRLAATDSPIVWASLLCNRSTPEALRADLNAKLVQVTAEPDPSPDVEFTTMILGRENIPWLRELPLPGRLEYLDRPYAVFRRALATHSDLPEEAIARLQYDPDPGVRRTIARRRDTPGDLLETVVRECGEDWGCRPLLVEHPNFPTAAFLRFADESKPQLRALACRDPVLPAAIVARLARDDDRWVRITAASHANLPAEDVIRLLGDEDLDIVEAAAASPALPPDAMDEIVECATRMSSYVRVRRWSQRGWAWLVRSTAKLRKLTPAQTRPSAAALRRPPWRRPSRR